MFLILALCSISSAQTSSVKEKNNHPVDQIPHNFQEYIEANKWPHDYYFDNPNIDKLTGYEEPLKHLRLMPYPREDIATRFKFFANSSTRKDKYLFDMSYNNDSSLNAFPSEQCSKLFVYAHGLNTAIDNPVLQNLINNILNNEYNTCFLGVDWKRGASFFSSQALASDVIHQTIYLNQAVNTIVVGRQSAYLLFLLVSRGKVRAENVHASGHSLGAQIAHFTGSYYTTLVKKLRSKRMTDWKGLKSVPKIALKIGRITGLDPAVPGFDGYPGAHLVPEDAVFVDIIHTAYDTQTLTASVGEREVDKSSGHVHFFPNGGDIFQPNCLVPMISDDLFTDLTLVFCAHLDALRYFYDSYDKKIPQQKFRSVNCPSFKLLDECIKTANSSMFGSMGRDAEKASGRGIQFLRYFTSRQPKLLRHNHLKNATRNFTNKKKVK